MLKQKKIALLLAAVLAVAGCGGGGSDDGGINNLGRSGSDSMENGAPSAPTAPTSGGTSGDNPATGGNPAPGTSVDQPNAASEPQLSGQMTLVANQMPYIDSGTDGDRNRFPTEYNAVGLEAFESTTGLFGVASGTSDGAVNSGFPATAPAPAAPVARFGFRVAKAISPIPAGPDVKEDTVVGRIAFSFSERADSPEMLPNQNELMSFVIDQVQIKTKLNIQTGSIEMDSVELLSGAQMHLYGRNAAGIEVRQTIPVQANAVRLEPVSNIIDDYGDTDSIILMVDLEAAFAQGVQQLAELNNMAGHFAMNVTMSFAQLDRPSEVPAEGAARTQRNLVGQPITVNDQPTVNGAGISGNVWIRAFPPQ